MLTELIHKNRLVLINKYSPRIKIKPILFLDRDGETFKHVVNFLRNDRRVFPEFADKNAENLFHKEIAFWGVDQNIEYNPPKNTRGSSLNKSLNYSKV